MRETKTYIYFLRLRIFSNIMSISRMGNLIYFSSIATGSNGYFLPGTKISLKMLQSFWYAASFQTVPGEWSRFCVSSDKIALEKRTLANWRLPCGPNSPVRARMVH